MHARSRPTLFLLMLLTATVLGGCDPEITVNPEIDLGDPEVEARVDTLEGEIGRLEAAALAHKARADALQHDVEALQEDNVVIRSEDGFTFRLNIQAAVVLVFAILGLTIFFVARMKFAADRRSQPD